MRIRSVVGIAVLAIFCPVDPWAVAQSSRNVAGDAPAPPDLSFLNLPFKSCKVQPALVAALSSADKCMIKSLSARCIPAGDCLVQCLVSKDGPLLGGGCWHACFETKFNLMKWSPPAGAEQCRKLGHTNGS